MKNFQCGQAGLPWYVVWGQSPVPDPGITWQDHQLSTVHIKPAVSPRERFVVAGDIWLSNRGDLQQTLGEDLTRGAKTDCQIVAQLWESLGIAALEQLQGMFALAVWDRDRQELWLMRDRVGAYTLYYTISGQTRWIAPRLRTLSPWRSTQLDLIALRDYLCCAFVPGERTLWHDVHELRPGTYQRWPDSTPHRYWHPTEQIIHSEKPLAWHGEQLRSLLESVVQAYLPPGQPVGAYLSGGIDSSCITALAAKFHDQPVHTYSIHFGADHPNELAFSNLVAEHCQTQHHVLEISPQQMWERLPETLSFLDDPIGDPLTVPNLLLGQLARETVQVILNGEGGDPCFGGPKNKPMLLNSLYTEAAGLAPKPDSDLVQTYLTSFQKCAAYLPNLLQPEIWNQVQAEPSVFAADLSSSAAYLNRLMMLNIKFKGADHILTKVNNLTSAAGLQGRSPLFDERIVELSLQIPPAYKLSGANEKAVLKAAVADLLPDSIINRPKSGMMVPVQVWFYKLWKRQAKAVLLNRKAAITPYLNQSLIRNWLAFRGDVWKRFGVKLWLLVSLELWLQVNANDP